MLYRVKRRMKPGSLLLIFASVSRVSYLNHNAVPSQNVIGPCALVLSDSCALAKLHKVCQPLHLLTFLGSRSRPRPQ